MIPPKIIRPRPSFPGPQAMNNDQLPRKREILKVVHAILLLGILVYRLNRRRGWEGGRGKEREDNDASSTSSSTLRMTKGSGSEGWLKSPEINTSLVEILSELVKRIEFKKILPWQGQRISQPKQFGHLFFSQQIFNSISYDSKYYWVQTKSSTGSQLPT